MTTTANNTHSNTHEAVVADNAAKSVVAKSRVAGKTQTPVKTEVPVNPVRRDLRFTFDSERMTEWHPGGVAVSNFFNALSVLFPEGEQFFIDSIRHYRDKGVIKDEKLLEEIRQFIGQEAMHGREHRDYNAAITKAGLGGDKMEAFVGRLLKGVQKRLPASHQLGATCALEHLTASFGGYILEDPAFLEGADEDMKAAWLWHSLEETEHKGVAYDVYEQAVGTDTRAYLIRTSSMLTAMAIFWPVTLSFFLYMNTQSGGFKDRKSWGTLSNLLFSRKRGIIRHFARDMADYFRRDFHPWDHDNSAELVRVKALAEQYDRKAKAKAAA